MQLMDIGGQRKEGRKWISTFQDVDALLIMVNIADYNHSMWENKEKNQMTDKFETFQQLLQHFRLFGKAIIKLVFTHIDRFKEQTKMISIRVNSN